MIFYFATGSLSSLGRSVVHVKIRGASSPAPLGAEISPPKKSIWVGPNSHVLLFG